MCDCEFDQGAGLTSRQLVHLLLDYLLVGNTGNRLNELTCIICANLYFCRPTCREKSNQIFYQKQKILLNAQV